MGLFSNRDAAFIEKLFDEHNHYIFSFCNSYCKNKFDAEDCLQEVFTRALSNASALLKHPAPHKWLFVTARIVALEKLRATNRIQKHEYNIDDFATALETESFEDIFLERHYTDTEIMLFRGDILETLNEKEYSLYVLRYIDKLDVGAISKRLNISYSNATTRLNRLKKKIVGLIAKMKL